MIYDFLCKSSGGKKLSRRESIKKGEREGILIFLWFSNFQLCSVLFLFQNACFNKVFKLTVTNNFQSFLSFALEKKVH